MKKILFLFLLTLITCKTTEEKIEIVLENEDFKAQMKKVIDSFKSEDIFTIISTLFETYSKIKNGTYPCFFAPCEICKDVIEYKKCANKCWAGMILDDKCLELCELTFC